MSIIINSKVTEIEEKLNNVLSSIKYIFDGNERVEWSLEFRPFRIIEKFKYFYSSEYKDSNENIAIIDEQNKDVIEYTYDKNSNIIGMKITGIKNISDWNVELIGKFLSIWNDKYKIFISKVDNMIVGYEEYTDVKNQTLVYFNFDIEKNEHETCDEFLYYDSMHRLKRYIDGDKSNNINLLIYKLIKYRTENKNVK